MIHDILQKLQSVFHTSSPLTCWSVSRPHLRNSKAPMNQDTSNTISCITLHITDLAQSQRASRPDASARS